MKPEDDEIQDVFDYITGNDSRRDAFKKQKEEVDAVESVSEGFWEDGEED